MPRKKKIKLSTKDGLIDRLEKIVEDHDVKTPDQLRAIKQLGDFRGYTVDKTYKALERMAPADLKDRVKEVVIPAVAQYLKEFKDLELIGTTHEFSAFVGRQRSVGQSHKPGASPADLRGGSEEKEPPRDHVEGEGGESGTVEDRVLLARHASGKRSTVVPKVDRPKPHRFRRKSEREEPVSSSGDQVVAGGIAPTPEDTQGTADLHPERQLPDPEEGDLPLAEENHLRVGDRKVGADGDRLRHPSIDPHEERSKR